MILVQIFSLNASKKNILKKEYKNLILDKNQSKKKVTSHSSVLNVKDMELIFFLERRNYVFTAGLNKKNMIQ
jgi:hypothetical protein